MADLAFRRLTKEDPLSTFHGLPAHILLNHFIVVLVPLVAILTIICALWPAARHRLIWLVVALAVLTVILTPLTINAGVWLQPQVQQSPALDTHMNLGATMTYFSAALVIAALLLAVMHVRQSRGHAVKRVAQGLIAVLVLAAAVAAAVQVYRVGQSGAQAVWGNQCHCYMHSGHHHCGCMAAEARHGGPSPGGQRGQRLGCRAA